ADVPVSKHVRQDFSKCKVNRAMMHYQHPLEWCRLILKEESTVSSAGSTQTISILFPVEKIFEDYVAAMLRKSLGKEGYSVKTQESRKYLCVSPRKFQMKPDIVIRKGGKCWVADTKWKMIDKRGAKHGVSQSDMYQLYAYGKKYAEDKCQALFLIYPKHEQFTADKTFMFEKDLSLSCLPFDCEARQQTQHLEIQGRLVATALDGDNAIVS
ncbi:MAG: restriction endonuclease, partial [Ghiorsea sp.]|nr:restriction endonuclease [Ghiorsea sp.]